MKPAESIRREFIDFFVKKHNHSFVKSSPVAPLDDPSLLFTNAGMNQFKDVFIGKGSRPYTRAVNSQKVIRASGKHNDLEDVGYDTYHHTFFEMLGNWSFGDYYKKEAIIWAWELLTDLWNIDKSRLWVTVHQSDQEAYDLWKNNTDIQEEHILFFGDKDNFWEMGSTGPCGPCSEIHYNKMTDPLLDGHDKDKGVNSSHDQFIEIWNLVFMQYFRNEDGSLTELPAKHVDTGMGFERIVAVLQNKISNYDTDIFQGLIGKLSELSGQKYEGKAAIAMRVAADHIRTISFSIADGALPSNEGRGYVLRRMLRRASRYGRNLGFRSAFLYQLVDILVAEMASAYPELLAQKELITRTIQAEEEQFNKTLDKGLELFEELKKKAIENKSYIIQGGDAFKLYDTFGFPFDLTQILAKENQLILDEKTFHEEMEKQRTRARLAGNFNVSHEDKRAWRNLASGRHSEFVGYHDLQCKTQIYKYAITDDKIDFVLEKTPFYAESGGQVADKGVIRQADTQFDVFDVQKDGDFIIHRAHYLGIEPSSDFVMALVKESERRSTANNHTATHLLHQALKDVCGSHIKQAGSLVNAERLRFDFNHFEKISDQQIKEIERIVNQEILSNQSVEVFESAYEDAIKSGVTALFGEKYGDRVRVVKIAEFSKELCGGTHVNSTGQIGSFYIISEASIASGVRRIEAITGIKAFEFAQTQKQIIKESSQLLNVNTDQINEKIKLLIDEKKLLEKNLQEWQEKLALSESKLWLQNLSIINGIQFCEKITDHLDSKLLKIIAADLINNQSNMIISLIGKKDDKLSFTLSVSKDLQSRFKAGKIVSEMAKLTGGGGGGKDDIASAGGKDLSKLDLARNYLLALIST